MLIFKLRKSKFDMGVIPNGGMHKNSINFLRQLNISDVRWHTRKTEFDDRNENHVLNRAIMHECLSGFKLLPELNTPETDRLNFDIYPCADLRRHWLSKTESAKGGKVGLFVSNKSDERKWDVSRWINLMCLLDGKADFFIFHTPEDSIGSEFSDSGATIMNTVSVQDMVAATSCMDLVVSADSAPVHLSSALHIPVVALFENRPEKYLRWYPVGVEYRLLKGERIVNDIEPDKVAEAINYFLTVPQ